MSKRPRDEKDDHNNSREQNEGYKPKAITCIYPSCANERFTNYLEYEHHIITHHDYECEECHRQFPSNSILNHHIDENHNPILAIKQERGAAIYKCFSDTCHQIFHTQEQRQLHMIKTHNYPPEYPFNIINRGI